MKTSPLIEKLVINYQAGNSGIGEAKDGEELIVVDQLASSASTFYEKMRSIVDNKDKHIIRWSKIHRTLVKLIEKHGQDDKLIAEKLLIELIESGLLPNHKVRLSYVNKLQYILLKYRASTKKFAETKLLDIAVSEIESMLYGNRQDSLADALYETVHHSVTCKSSDKTTSLDMQIYLACRLSLLEDDDNALFYSAFKQYFPGWESFVDIPGAKFDTLPQCIRQANKDVASRLYRRISRKIRDKSIYFMAIRKIIEENVDFSDEKAMGHIADIVKKLINEQHDAVQKMGIRAFWYILITKTAIVLPLEYFVTLMFFTSVETFPLYLNLLFHPMLLLYIIATTKKSDDINQGMIIGGVISIIEGRKSRENFTIENSKRVGTALKTVYLLMAVSLFYGLVTILSTIGLKWVSIVFFLILLAVISFFGFRIRTKSKRLQLLRYERMQEDIRPSGILFVVLTLPLIEAGRRLSDGVKSISVFVDFMDFFIEVPFKTMVKSIGSILSIAEAAVQNFIWGIKAPFVALGKFYRKIKDDYASFIKDKKEKLRD